MVVPRLLYYYELHKKTLGRSLGAKGVRFYLQLYTKIISTPSSTNCQGLDLLASKADPVFVIIGHYLLTMRVTVRHFKNPGTIPLNTGFTSEGGGGCSMKDNLRY